MSRTAHQAPLNGEGLPAGYVARPLDLHDVDGLPDGPDVDLAFDVVCAAEAAVTGRAEDSREAIRANLTNPDAQRDLHRLLLTEAGEPVGLVVIERDDANKTFFVDSYATPTHGRRVLPSLVAMGMATVGPLATDDDWKAEAGTFVQDEVYVEALQEAGFSEVRRFWRMIIDLGPEHEREPVGPEGVTRTVAATDDERRMMHLLEQESFAEHFGFAPRPYDEFIAWGIDRRDARPDLWWIAWRDDRPVGLCVMDDSHAGRGASHVRMLGVVPAARGRGIGSWLLRSAFAQAATEGRTAVTLTVDAENSTGATALYEGVGMRAEQVIALYRRPLAEAPAGSRTRTRTRTPER